KSLPVTITDDQNRTGSTNIALTVNGVATCTIMAVQGHGATSPVAGMTVTVTGVVTAGHTPRTPKAFFMPDQNGDGDPTTSDGIYVYKGSSPGVAVGDRVTVTGEVSEFSGSTELGTPLTITPLSHGNALPDPYDLSANPPTDDYNTGVCM